MTTLEWISAGFGLPPASEEERELLERQWEEFQKMNFITASEARKISEADITKELERIEKGIRETASYGYYSVEHRLPMMDDAQREKIVDVLKQNGFSVSLGDFYDQPSGYGWWGMTISWGQRK